MDLKTFVSETITQIADGIKDAQAKETGAWICPPVKPNQQENAIRDGQDAAQMLSFDIAVTTTDASGSTGGGSLKVLGVSLGGGINQETQNAVASRVQFSIPVVWPRIEKEQIPMKIKSPTGYGRAF